MNKVDIINISLGKGRKYGHFPLAEAFLYRPMLFDETQTNTARIEEMSDEDILALSIDNPKYFEVLVGRYQEAFIRKGKHILPDQEEAVFDIVQDTFVKIYLNAGKFKKQEGASFKSWGYKILINTCFTFYQKRKREKQFTIRLDDEIAELVPGNDEAKFDKKLDTDYLISLISRLPNLLARVLTLHVIEGKSQSEVASIEGVSVGAIRTRIHRAKKELERIKLDLI